MTGPRGLLSRFAAAVGPYLPPARPLTLRDATGAAYVDRWGIEAPALGGVLLHRLGAPDPGVDLHDHPWRFRSLVLAGSYVEEVAHGLHRTRSRWSVAGHDLDDRHRIVEVAPGTWTLVLRGRRRQEWGFYVDGEWVAWRDYDYATRRPGSASSNKPEEEHAAAGHLRPADDPGLRDSWGALEATLEVTAEIPVDDLGAPVEVEAHQSAAEPVPAWCPRCLLTTALRSEQILTRSDTLAEIARFQVTICGECGWSTPSVSDGFAG